MRTIKIEAKSNGFHDNLLGNVEYIPDGWAVIPDDMLLPASFPFVDIVVANGIVTSMVEHTKNEPTLDERITALEDSNAEMTEALDLLLSGVTE